LVKNSKYKKYKGHQSGTETVRAEFTGYSVVLSSLACKFLCLFVGLDRSPATCFGLLNSIHLRNEEADNFVAFSVPHKAVTNWPGNVRKEEDADKEGNSKKMIIWEQFWKDHTFHLTYFRVLFENLTYFFKFAVYYNVQLKDLADSATFFSVQIVWLTVGPWQCMTNHKRKKAHSNRLKNRLKMLRFN